MPRYDIYDDDHGDDNDDQGDSSLASVCEVLVFSDRSSVKILAAANAMVGEKETL